MKKKVTMRALGAVLGVILLSVTVLSSVSCGAPEMDEVRDTFVSLIEASEEVNRVLFGEGLSVYGDMKYDEETKTYYSIFYTKENGKLCAYYDKENGEYVTLRFGDKGEKDCVVSDEENGVYLYKTDIEYSDHNNDLPDALLPSDYRFVRIDEVAISSSEIAEMAAKVYSEDYLADVFETLMGGLDEGTVITDETLLPRYKEISDTENGRKFLVKAVDKLCPPIVNEVRQYDLDSMTMTKNSRRNFVTVEINSYGTYVDMDEGKVKTGWSTVSISFVRTNGEWRLDTPTY